MRIAILGAGPGGLSAAERLKEKGYKDIVIYEKQNKVGGQSESRSYILPDGKEIIYDLGSIQPMPSKELLHLIKKHNLHFGRGLSLHRKKTLSFYDFEKNIYFPDFNKYLLGFPAQDLHFLMYDILKLSYHLWRFRALKQAGYQNCKFLNEATIPLEQWIKEKKFKLIENSLILSLCTTASGSSKERCEHIAAMYGIKNLFQMLGHRITYINGAYQPLREGYQTLWKKVAEHHDVRLSSKITHIIREKDGIILNINGSEEKFDKLIVAFPIEQIKKILNITAEEMDIANRVHYCPCWRGWFIVKNFPKDRVIMFPENYFSSNTDKFIFPIVIPEGNIDEHHCLYSFVLQTGDGTVPPDSQVIKATEERIKKHFMGEVTEWGDIVYWKYYKPHFFCEDIINGIYSRFDSIQGVNNTYYTGALLSGDGHAHVLGYSYNLIDKYF